MAIFLDACPVQFLFAHMDCANIHICVAGHFKYSLWLTFLILNEPIGAVSLIREIKTRHRTEPTIGYGEEFKSDFIMALRSEIPNRFIGELNSQQIYHHPTSSFVISPPRFYKVPLLIRHRIYQCQPVRC